MNDASSSISDPAQSQLSHDEISRHAQELWERYGRPTGRDEEIWLEAERALRAQRASASAPDVGSSSAAATAPAPSPAAPPPTAGTRAVRAGGATATPRMPGSRLRSKG